MNHKILAGLIILIITVSSSAQIQFGGYVQTDIRMFLKKENRFYWNENRLNVHFNAMPSDNAQLYSEIWIRNFGFPTVNTSSDLMRQEKDKVSPWSLLLREIYVDLYGLIIPELDIRIGLQRIAWGTGDRFNPTDNLNPDDLEDIWDFGRHLGSGSIKASYYLADITFTAVFIPVFTPATMPVKDWASAFSSSGILPTGLTPRSIVDRIVTPENSLAESSMYGFKLGKNFWEIDFSVSYFYGRDDIPWINNVTVTAVDTTGLVDLSIDYFYPRIDVVGLDAAGALGDVGFWFEGALYMPETYAINSNGNRNNSSSLIMVNPYLKYVIGADYTFRNGWYINAQYIHGLFHERNENEIGDYFVLALERKLFGEKIKIIPVSGGIEIRRWYNLINNYALIFNPELNYYPIDNSRITLGLRLLEGSEKTVFGSLRDNDEIYFRVRLSF
jgi:hypothetical protein